MESPGRETPPDVMTYSGGLDWFPKAHTFTEGGAGTSSSGLYRDRWGRQRWCSRAGVREVRLGFGYRSATPRLSKRRLPARERSGLANPATFIIDGRRLSDRGRTAIQPQSSGPGSDCRFGGWKPETVVPGDACRFTLEHCPVASPNAHAVTSPQAVPSTIWSGILSMLSMPRVFADRGARLQVVDSRDFLQPGFCQGTETRSTDETPPVAE